MAKEKAKKRKRAKKAATKKTAKKAARKRTGNKPPKKKSAKKKSAKKKSAKKKKTAKKKAKKTVTDTANDRRVAWSRDEVAEVQDKLGELSRNDHERLGALLSQLEPDAQAGGASASRAGCIAAVFPDDDDEVGDRNLRAFPSRFNRVAAPIGLRIESRKRGGERRVRILGPDRTPHLSPACSASSAWARPSRSCA